MTLTIDRDEDTPLRSQIAAAIRDKITRGVWSSGTRLPSGRDLAEQLRVNRTTVQLSLRDLQDEGWVESGVGRGTFVLGAPRAISSTDGTAFDWTARLGTGPTGPNPSPDPQCIPLSRAISHRALFPAEELREAFQRAFMDYGTSLLEYSSPAGWAPLRRALRDRFAVQGIDMSRNEVLIVNGSQQGLDLVGRALAKDGRVLTSTPTFSGALDVFREHGATVTGHPLDDDGLDVAALGRDLRGASLIYTIPSRHNPTGVDLSPERRRELLRLSRASSVPILEDDWLGELREQGEGQALKADDESGLVLTLGTVSKVLAPGLRVGWLIVPRGAMPRLLELKKRTDLATCLPSQAALHDLLTRGVFDRHVEKVRAEFRERERLVNAAAKRHFPASVRLFESHSGMVAWARLPAGSDVRRLVALAAARNVELTPSDPFNPHGGPMDGFRIAYAAPALNRLKPGLESLGAALHELLSAPPTLDGPALV